MKISETIDYNKFELYSMNRDVSREKFLKKSLEKYGWIPAFPMYVVKNGSSRLKIKDGHHRFHVARALQIPVKYVVCEENSLSIQELNKTVRSWSINDYLDSFVRMGKPSYLYLKEYCQRTGIAVTVAMPMLAGNSACASGLHLLNSFKDGKFDATTEGINTGMVIENIIKVMMADGNEFCCQKSFVGALSKICAVKEVSTPQLIKKLRKYSVLLHKQPTTDLYIKNLEEVYNRASRAEILPLYHLVKAEMKRRHDNVIKRKTA